MAISSEESHLLNIGVNKDFRRSGYGERILKKMIIAAEVMGSKKIILEVRVSNKIAYRLYEKLGFLEIGERKKYYRLPEGREDAYVMSKTLKKGFVSNLFFSKSYSTFQSQTRSALALLKIRIDSRVHHLY